MPGAKDHPRAREPERGTKVPLRSHYGVNDVFKEKRNRRDALGY